MLGRFYFELIINNKKDKNMTFLYKFKKKKNTLRIRNASKCEMIQKNNTKERSLAMEAHGHYTFVTLIHFSQMFLENFNKK